ncbi:VOC family protein [Kordiimonas gwangyangensis]|uniref:VOC family protein n=1 Tax=Kordiimonas gwangyangensis TaxID=288022 RepID=UPI0003696BA8|nr:VOC family protein [Kordiimonas gwangyangensis]
MSYISALGYIGLSVRNLDAWVAFAENILGLSCHTRADGSIDVRCDSYAWRIRLIQGEEDDLVFAGWEVAGPEQLRLLAEHLQNQNVEVRWASASHAEDRGALELFSFTDCEGLQLEAFCGPLQLTEKPFASPHGVAFKTGSQGLGHIVLTAKDIKAQENFYRSILGFRVSDYINTEVIPGRPITLSFMRCNARHHSLALAPVPLPKRLVHFMLEVTDVDAVGRAMYRATDAGHHLSFTLGRHSNDEMLSFYVLSPSGFDIEYGWGGLAVDEDEWHIRTHRKNSAWGHRFQRPPRAQAPAE